MIRLPYQRLELPGFTSFLRLGFAARLLICRWKTLAMALFLIVGPVALAMWLVPYSVRVTIEVPGLGPSGVLTNESNWCGGGF
jgi:hypothetical protein